MWSDTLLDATFRGVPFDVLRSADVATRAVSEHSYPYADGADTDDMGRDARRVNLDAILFGDDYEVRLQALLAALEVRGPGELVHPVFGAMRVQVRRHEVRHDADGLDQCTVAIEFTETRESAPFFTRVLPGQRAAVIGEAGTRAVAAASEAHGKAVDGLRKARPLAVLDRLRESMLGPVRTLQAQVQGVVTSGLDVLSVPRAWSADVVSLLDGALDARAWTSASLMADYTAITQLVGKLDVVAAVGLSFPPILPGGSPSEDQAIQAVRAVTLITQANAIALAVQAVLTAEADPANGPTLSPPEIERIANAARARLDAAIETSRTTWSLETARGIAEPLRDQALAVQDAAVAIIEARPPLITRVVDAPGNLRLLAHRWYDDHTRAPELWRLNLGRGLRAPNHIATGDRLSAYAGG